jgi:predicted nuclease of predicted toxin-antitoxin system
VSLLLDENLSTRLVRKIADLFPGATHVSSEGLLRASDEAIWDYARENQLCILTADADFYELAISRGSPPKVVWLRGCDYPTEVAAGLVRSQAIRISQFLQDPERSVLILRPK